MNDPHTILGLGPGASRGDITRAYRKLARRYPPELNPERFARIHHAYEILNSLENRMAEAKKDPEATLEALFPQPSVTLVSAPPPEPLAVEDLETFLRPLHLELLQRILASPGKN